MRNLQHLASLVILLATRGLVLYPRALLICLPDTANIFTGQKEVLFLPTRELVANGMYSPSLNGGSSTAGQCFFAVGWNRHDKNLLKKRVHARVSFFYCFLFCLLMKGVFMMDDGGNLQMLMHAICTTHSFDTFPLSLPWKSVVFSSGEDLRLTRRQGGSWYRLMEDG